MTRLCRSLRKGSNMANAASRVRETGTSTELADGDYSTARDRMVREICEALETIASQRPLLLVIEDLHLADQGTVDLISALARRRESAKLMLIGTCRPVDLAFSEHSLKVLKQDLLVHHLCQEIALEPLGEADLAEYLVAESRGAVPPKGLAQLLHRHTAGNPLFTESVLNHMQQRGFLSHDNANWRIHVPLESIGLEVPETLRQIIEVQIDRLSLDEQLGAGGGEPCKRRRFPVCGRTRSHGSRTGTGSF